MYVLYTLSLYHGNQSNVLACTITFVVSESIIFL